MVDPPRRKIRSFVRRPGRTTIGQRRALSELLPRWGIEYREGRIDLAEVFEREAPRVLDIGFGDGEALLGTAANFSDVDYLGVEVHEPGIGHLLVMIERAGLPNIRLVARDAVDVIANMLPDAAFDAVNLFFPDPWPKKRHHKRRIVQSEFVSSVARIMKRDGLFHIATDWANYAEQVLSVMRDSPEFLVLSEQDAEQDRLSFRPPTKFEERGLKLGHDVVDLYYRKRR